MVIVVSSSLLLCVACTEFGYEEQAGQEQQQDEAQQEEMLKQQEQQKQQEQKSKPQAQTKQPKIDKQAMDKSREIAQQTKGIKGVAVLAIEQDVSVAVDVAQMRRFQLKSIRKEIFAALRKEYPHKTIRVTTDRKIFWEMEKLERQADEQKPKVANIQKTLQKLNDDM